MGILAFLLTAAALAAEAALASASGMVCTNEVRINAKVPTSHALRAGIESNATWMMEMLQHRHDHGGEHPVPSDEAAWMGLRHRKAGRGVSEYDWAMLYRVMKRSGLDGAAVEGWHGGRAFLKAVSLHDVRLEPGSLHGRAQQTNLEYLVELDVDSLVWSFRKLAGLPTPGMPYGGWEGPTKELRGHFVGHYLSATALMWASTHNATLLEKMGAIVSALHECQEAIGTGYLAAFPTEFFDRYEQLVYVWAPYYTIHKIMAGLLDQYNIIGNNQALKILIKMVDYFGNRVLNVIKKYSIARHYEAMNEETGAMNDVLYNLYAVTKDPKHLMLAHLFDKPCFMGPLAVKADVLAQMHVNTHIPIVVGGQRRYEITGDPLYKEIGEVFLSIVNSSHTYATGGTSNSEHWGDPNRLASTLSVNNEESCTTYNMLKVSRNLFRWTKKAAYADYYEKALTNGVLGIQRGTEPGIMIYFIPMSPGASKAIGGSSNWPDSPHGWGTKFNTFWCCYGTAIESFSKLGDSIYFEEEDDIPKLYITQFISSSLNWKSGGIVLHQEVKEVTSSDQYLQAAYVISTDKNRGQKSTLNIRIPFWAPSDKARIVLNQQKSDVPMEDGFWSITKDWSPEDKITIQFPIGIRTEAIQDDRPENAAIKSIHFGPYLLAGLTCKDWDLKPRNSYTISDWIVPVPLDYNSQLVSLTQETRNGTLYLSNLNSTIEDVNRTITMEQLPKLGTNSANQATFRLILLKNATRTNYTFGMNIIGESIMLEPFDLPGKVLRHNGLNNSLSTSNEVVGYDKPSVFRVIAGLDGSSSTISLESKDTPGCFLHSNAEVHLVCSFQGSKDASFQQATSFKLNKGLSEYHPISFIAKGTQRNFLLQPLMSLKDEHYSIYFRVGI